jgi:hypothetical protein
MPRLEKKKKSKCQKDKKAPDTQVNKDEEGA